jgi:putative addiction module component (TIGR02574 family)
MVSPVPITLEQIVAEARHWPPEKLGELVDRLNEELHTTDPDNEKAWKKEIRRRLAEIENGTVKAVAGEKVSARIRKIVGR